MNKKNQCSSSSKDQCYYLQTASKQEIKTNAYYRTHARNIYNIRVIIAGRDEIFVVYYNTQEDSLQSVNFQGKAVSRAFDSNENQ